MLPKATLEKVSEKGDIDLNTLIEKIKRTYKKHIKIKKVDKFNLSTF